MREVIFENRGCGKMCLDFGVVSTDEHVDIFSANNSPPFQLQNYIIKISRNNSIKVDKFRHLKTKSDNKDIIRRTRAIECNIYLVRR